MKKRSTFDIVWRVALLIGGLAVWHLAARAAWMWNPIDRIFNIPNLNPVKEECVLSSINGTCYVYDEVDDDRTLFNYNTDWYGIIISHIEGAFMLVFSAVVLCVIGYLLYNITRWIVFQDTEDDDADVYDTACTDPSCTCSEHKAQDWFDTSKNRWVSSVKEPIEEG